MFYRLTWRRLEVVLQSSSPIDQIVNLLGLEKEEIPFAESVDLSIDKSDKGYVLEAKFIGKTYCFARVDDLIVHAVNLISTCFLNQSKESVLHSGAIVVNGGAVLFSGLPHAGKSTFALHAWLAGIPLINDDLLYYDEQGHTVASFPKPLKPRLPSLDIPPPIVERAGVRNLTIGHFLHDIGLFVGKGAQGMVGYDQEIPVRSFFFIERGMETKAVPLSRMQALVMGLAQVMPNASCLKIGALIHRLDQQKKNHLLTIADNDQEKALELMRRCSG